MGIHKPEGNESQAPWSFMVLVLYFSLADQLKWILGYGHLPRGHWPDEVCDLGAQQCLELDAWVTFRIVKAPCTACEVFHWVYSIPVLCKTGFKFLVKENVIGITLLPANAPMARYSGHFLSVWKIQIWTLCGRTGLWIPSVAFSLSWVWEEVLFTTFLGVSGLSLCTALQPIDLNWSSLLTLGADFVPQPVHVCLVWDIQVHRPSEGMIQACDLNP